MSTISPDNIFALGAILFGLACLGFAVDAHPLGRRTSGVVWILALAMLLSNTSVIPLKSPAYDFIGGSLVPVAIPLLLLKADMRKIFSESGWVMFSFILACIATVAGAVIGYALLDLGDIGPKVAGTYTGGWIGGAVNFVAVSQAVEMTPQEFSEALGASAGVSITALLLLTLLPSVTFITKHFPATEGIHAASEDPIDIDTPPKPFLLIHLTGALALSFSICAVSHLLVEQLDLQQYTILLITLLTIIIANLFSRQLSGLQGEFELGMMFMYLFFAAIGAGTDALSFITSASVLLVYGLSIIFIHLTLILVMARVFRIDFREAIVASAAALVGPAPTAAIAATRGWAHLVTPGIMCGIFGYVIGTFVGVSVTEILQNW